MTGAFKAALVRFFSNPLHGGIGTIIGIFGTLLAVYFYVEGKSEPQLVGLVQPARSTLVSSEASAKLQIFSDGKLVQGAVTTAQVVLWNNGRKEIRSSDILAPVQIYFEPPMQLISAELKAVTRPVTGVRLDSAHLSSGIVPLDWAILESQDGLVVQLTYVGEHANIKIRGTVVGQKEIEFYTGNSTPQKSEAIYVSRWGRILGWILLCAVGIGFVFSFINTYVEKAAAIAVRQESPRAPRRQQMVRVVNAILVTAGITFVASIGLLLLFGSAPKAPFAL